MVRVMVRVMDMGTVMVIVRIMVMVSVKVLFME